MALDKAKAAKKQIVGVLIDIGNSETRVRIKYKPLKGLESVYPAIDSHTFTLSNHYICVDSDYAISPDYRNANSTVLNINGQRVLHGEVVEREFRGRWDIPTGKGNKSDEAITEWTLHRIFLEVNKILADTWGISVGEVDVAYNVYILLPPAEHLNNKQGMIDLIKGIDEVVEMVPEGEVDYKPITHTILCNDIQAYPEGITAFFGIRVNIEGNKLTPNKDVERFMRGYVLVMDIGAGTTDFAIMKDGKLMSDTRMSLPIAGNQIKASVKTNIANADAKLRMKLQTGIQNMASVMNEAMLDEEGLKAPIDCSVELGRAKEAFASSLVNSLRDYAEVHQDCLPLVNGVLVVGGANVTAKRNGEIVSQPVETYILPKLSAYIDDVELMPLGNRDARYLNLDGLESVYITQMSKMG